MTTPDPIPVRAFLDGAHHALATAAGAFASETAAILPEPLDDAEARTRARAWLARLGEGGWLEPIRRQDWRACCLTREALGAASPLADAVFALQCLGSMPITLAGSDAQREEWLPRVARGEAMTAFAMTEPGAGSDVAGLDTTAREVEGGWELAGAKTLISNAGIADVYCLFAVTDRAAGTRGVSCFVLPKETAGLRFAGAQVLSAPHPLGELSLEACRVPADSLLGDAGAGFKLGMRTLDRLRPTVAAAACGMAARALAEAIGHARSRKQFGQPLASFQLVQEKLAAMAIELAASRLLTYRAAWEADRGAERITLEAATAKAYATEAAQRIVDQAVQVLGGRGVLADSPVDRLYRSVRALRIYEGTTEVQHLVIARHILG
jgi:acyl-CoA dehydrogenase